MNDRDGGGPMEARPVAAIILNWNRSDLAIQCVEALLADNSAVLDIIVVDNGSEPEDLRRLADSIPEEVKVVALEHNSGYASGNNAGARIAIRDGAQFIMVMNNDVVMAGRDCEACASVLAQHSDLGAIGPTIVSVGESTAACSRIDFAGGTIDCLGNGRHLNHGTELSVLRTHLPELYATEWLAGSAVMFRADAWMEVGGFDDDYFMYFEDVDISLRLLASGWKIACLRDVVAIHIGEASSTSLPGSGRKQRAYYSTRNRLSMVRTHRRAVAYAAALIHSAFYLLPRAILSGLIRRDFDMAWAVGAGILDHLSSIGGPLRTQSK